MRRAINEAAWSITSKVSPGSSQPSASGTSTRWPEDEIGMNSVRPWTAPRTRAWRRDTAREHMARKELVRARRTYGPRRNAQPFYWRYHYEEGAGRALDRSDGGADRDSGLR